MKTFWFEAERAPLHFTLAFNRIIRTYLQELRMGIAFHSSCALAQNVRDRFPAFRFVKLLRGSLIEQENRDLLQKEQHSSLSVVTLFELRNSRRRIQHSELECKNWNPITNVISFLIPSCSNYRSASFSHFEIFDYLQDGFSEVDEF